MRGAEYLLEDCVDRADPPAGRRDAIYYAP